MQAQAWQEARDAQAIVLSLQQANAELATERGAALRAHAEAAAERDALSQRAATAEKATCALMEQQRRDIAELGAL
jgi:hypothetical protein